MLFQKIIVYENPPGGRGSIASSRPISIIIEIESERPAKGKYRRFPFMLHFIIGFSIDAIVNMLTPCSKTIHTKFTKPASF